MAGYRRGKGGQRSLMAGCMPRLVIALVLIAFSVGSFLMTTKKEVNPITGEEQRIALTVDQEIALGLQTAPHMAQQHGGLHPNREMQALVDSIGRKLVASTKAAESPYQYEFHLLADPRAVNAFALPGGQIFLTYALFSMLKTEDEVAGVLGHEIGHVVARHSAQQMAKSKLISGISNAAVVATSDGRSGGGQMAQMMGKLLNTRYGRDDELESDRLGVQFMVEAGYQPEALIQVMKVLEQSAGSASPPEFLSTHPNPGRRIERIKEEIAKYR